MAARLASGLVVSALLRLAEGDGGFGTVIARGDREAGAILILLAERGRRVQLFERLLQPDGNYAWAAPLGAGLNESDIDRFLEKRLRFDPDSWVVELDVASAERFAAEIRAFN